MQRICTLTVLIFAFVSGRAWSATEDVNRFSHCGEYHAIGKLKRSASDDYFLILYGDSSNEASLKVVSSSLNPKSIKAKLRAYVDSKVEILGNIRKKLRLREGEIDFSNIQELMPNPIDPFNDSGLILVKESACK